MSYNLLYLSKSPLVQNFDLSKKFEKQLPGIANLAFFLQFNWFNFRLPLCETILELPKLSKKLSEEGSGAIRGKKMFPKPIIQTREPTCIYHGYK